MLTESWAWAAELSRANVAARAATRRRESWLLFRIHAPFSLRLGFRPNTAPGPLGLFLGSGQLAVLVSECVFVTRLAPGQTGPHQLQANVFDTGGWIAGVDP